MTAYLALPDAQRSVERARVATVDDLLAPEVSAMLQRQAQTGGSPSYPV